MMDSKSRWQSAAQKSGMSLLKNWGPRKFYICSFFTTSRLNGEYLLNERWHRQSDKGIEKYKGFRSFYPSSVFCSVPTLQAALTWRPTANLNEMALDVSATQIRSPKNLNLAMALHRTALSGNASLIATFSDF